MAIKVKAVERKQIIGNYAGQYRYVLSPDLYTTLDQKKVIEEAALRGGISRGVMQAAWDAAGQVIKAWATEGHSVALPGLGNMRFGLRAKSVATVDEVKSSLIKTRRIIFVPNSELKQELSDTSIKITCIDRDGNVVSTVTSDDSGEVEDNENTNTDDNSGTSTGDNSGTSTGNSGSDNTGGSGSSSDGDEG